MMQPLVLLAIASIGCGWLGTALGNVLAPAVGPAPAVHAVSSLGALAGGLGLVGFAIAGFWVKTVGSGAMLPPVRLAWVDGVRDLSALVSRAVTSLHDGRLVGYLFCGVVGTGLTVYLVLLR